MKNKVTVMKVCSPVMDLTTPDVWRLFAATDFPVSEIYNKMYDAGIAVEDQRTGSLLNFAATKSISSVKTIEPEIYAKINARFQNVEFMSQFGKSGYYDIGKPADTEWNGRNHIKAGMSLENIKKISDLYQKLLDMHGVEYKREGDEFIFPRDKSKRVLSKDRPLGVLSESGVEII